MERFLDFLDYLYWSIRHSDFKSPIVSVVIIFLAVFSLFKRWILVTLLLLLIVFGIGSEYLLLEMEYSEDIIPKICFIIYGLGAIFMVVVAVYDFFFRGKV